MIRKFGFVVLVMALIVSACGRQVTPDRNGSGPGAFLNPGTMSVKFRVKQPFNFSNYAYVIVFNTSGTTDTPHANGQQNNYRGYSFAIIVEGQGTTANARAVQYYRPPGSPDFQAPVIISIGAFQQLLQLNPNTDGQNQEFTVIFDRHIFTGVGSPSPSPTASASATPSAGPSPTPSGSPTPTPTPVPFGGTWYFNYFVTGPGPNYTPVDSLGQGGATDTTYQSVALDTTTPFDTGSFLPITHINPPNDPSATIAGGEIANQP